MPRTRQLVLGVAAASLVATVIVAVVPALAFAYRGPELHIALQTAEALIAFLVAYLVLGRLRRRRRRMDLLLCLAFATLAISNLAFSAVPAIFASEETVGATWTSLSARLIGAGLFVAAAIVPDRRIRFGRREEFRAAILLLAGLALVWAVVEIFAGSLPAGVVAAPGDPHRPELKGHWSILSAQALSFVLYSTAAVGFTRRFERTGDRLLSWLAVASVLSAAARLNYLLYPSLFSDYVYTGDAFRLGFYLVVLAAAANEIRSYWRDAAATAALEERRRIARDLHDGLAQELASIQRNLRWLDPDDDFVRRAGASAERALAQARRAILALGDEAEASLAETLGDAVRVVAEREGMRVALELSADATLGYADREALILIASEAITNAARHAETDFVRVELSGDGRLRLRIVDFGRGFRPGERHATGGTGFGLQAMEERARGIGATLRVESLPGEGTTVEVVL